MNLVRRMKWIAVVVEKVYYNSDMGFKYTSLSHIGKYRYDRFQIIKLIPVENTKKQNR